MLSYNLCRIVLVRHMECGQMASDRTAHARGILHDAYDPRLAEGVHACRSGECFLGLALCHNNSYVYNNFSEPISTRELP
jgi:hypothetical protein